MSTLGQKPATQHVSTEKQTITGNGGTSYTLQQSVSQASDIEVFVNNTRQEPTVAYTASGTTLTMTGAVNSSDSFYVIFQGKAIQTAGLPVDAAITASTISASQTLAVTGNTTVGGTLGITGDLTVDTDTLKVDTTNDKVGINTANPSDYYSDELVVTAADEGGMTIVTGTTHANYINFADGTSGNAAYRGFLKYDHNDDMMILGTSAASAMVIDSSGNVGIGNSNPSSFGSLTDNLVIGTTSGENGMTIASGTANSGRLQFSDDGSFRGAIEYAHSNDFMYFYTAGSQRLKITNNGYIQSPPTAGNTTGSSANMHVTSGGEFAKSTSSKRYKNTINDATHGLAELLQLRSVTFKHNSDSETVYGGLIAEEVHDVGLTEFVEYNDSDKPESIHYTHMISLTIKSIQELSAKVTALETENATQATQIADLIARVTALESE